MNWMERMRTMLQTWLEIQPAQGRRMSIREPVGHGANVLRNRVWYRGDASELDQLFKQLGEDAVGRARFWAAAPESENLRKGPQRPACRDGPTRWQASCGRIWGTDF